MSSANVNGSNGGDATAGTGGSIQKIIGSQFGGKGIALGGNGQSKGSGGAGTANGGTFYGNFGQAGGANGGYGGSIQQDIPTCKFFFI